jgi:hypothetical protein
MRESLFHGAEKALPHNGKARSARRYSHYGTQKRLSDVSEEPFSAFSKYGSVPMEASPTPHDTFSVTLPFLFREFPL